MSDAYLQFLREKISLARFSGFDVPLEEINPALKPHTRDIVRWMVKGGNRAVFASFGLHKTATQLEALRQIGLHRPGLRLQVLPLGVRQEFFREVQERFTGDCAVDLRFIRSNSEISDERTIYLTNYESVRESKVTPGLFRATSLDEASILRSYGSKTYQEFLPAFAPVEFKFVATATPDPNRYKELIHYAGYLGVMDTGQALTRFFQRDSEKAGNLTLYPHKQQEFWLWVASWAVFITKPSDLCRCPCHSELTSLASASGISPFGSGYRAQSATAPGVAHATAGANTSLAGITSPADGSSAAAAFDPSTDAREPLPTVSGRECSSAAPTPGTKTGPTMAAAASLSASGGTPSPTSSPTWASPPTAEPSSGATTAGTTSLETASGQPAKRKRATPAATSSSSSAAEVSPSQLGLKNSASATGSCTHGTSSAGHRSASSQTWCDSCRCDEGYNLPALDVRWHEIPSDYAAAGADKQGQNLLIPDVAMGLSAAAAEKRGSLPARVAKAREIVEADPADHFIVWHDLEDERHALQAAIPEAVSVWGSQDLDEREDRIIGFSDGQHRILSTKPVIAGSGCNFQRHCHREVFAGVGFKFNDFIQAVHRTFRFGQKHQVRVDVIHTEAEREIVASLKEKWRRHDQQQQRMAELVRQYGLDHLAMQDTLARTIGIERSEVRGERFTVANNDCVLEAELQPENSVDLIVTSIPFANHYEYTPSYNDFGHTEGNDHFWRQMDFLTPQLLRILKPGRIACIHVKDRVLFGNVTGLGAPSMDCFHEETVFHFRKHGFIKMGMVTIVTDVVRENNQTYRLGYTEMCKDGTKMGVGCSEYLLIFRKPQSDTSRGYADVPVVKSKADYSLGRWQVDAHALWRSSGNRLLSADEMAALGPAKLAKFFTDDSLRRIYDYDRHVDIGEQLQARGALPSTFMSLAPGSHHPEVWHDVNRMQTLNGEQSRRSVEQHVCPLQFDIVDRCIERWSMPGEVVYDPFHGLGTVGVRAIRAGRQARGSELSAAYFVDQVHYLRAAERDASMPGLFDLEPEPSTEQA